MFVGWFFIVVIYPDSIFVNIQKQLNFGLFDIKSSIPLFCLRQMSISILYAFKVKWKWKLQMLINQRRILFFHGKKDWDEICFECSDSKHIIFVFVWIWWWLLAWDGRKIIQGPPPVCGEELWAEVLEQKRWLRHCFAKSACKSCHHLQVFILHSVARLFVVKIKIVVSLALAWHAWQYKSSWSKNAFITIFSSLEILWKNKGNKWLLKNSLKLKLAPKILILLKCFLCFVVKYVINKYPWCFQLTLLNRLDLCHNISMSNATSGKFWAKKRV